MMKTVLPLLSHYCFHEMGVGEGGCSFERGTYFKFWSIGWHLFEGGVNSKIYGTCMNIFA